MTIDVFVHGTVFLDVVMTGLHGRPAAGTEVFTDGMGTCPGGIANLAVAASRLDLSAGLSAAFGDDLHADFCWRAIEEEGVDLTPARRVPGWPTPVTVSMAVDGDRSMVTHMVSAPVGEDELAGTLPLARAVIGYLRPHEPSWRRCAREQGSLVVADVGWDGSGAWARAVLDQLASCDVFLPNEVEATAYTRTDDAEAALNRLAELVPVVAVTSGASGSCAVDSTTGERAEAPAVPVQVLDTTGAGDVFDTAFTLGTLEGWSLPDRLAFANLCAALSTRHVGGSLAAPGWSDVASWWSAARGRAQGGDAAAVELGSRYGFLDDVLADRPLREVRRAPTTPGRTTTRRRAR